MMQKDNKNYLKFDHDAYAKTKTPDDFWGQIRRTVEGKPVSNEQIKLIINTIHSTLSIKPSDALLDIACGNGALSQLLFSSLSVYLGVDLSEYLIAVAKANFEALPNYQFRRQGAAECVRFEPQPEKFSKVLCYGSFSYFAESDADEVLRTLHQRFCNVESIFIGNLPDKDRSAEFYREKTNYQELLDYRSQIGIWRTRSEFKTLANNAGWKVSFTNMPAEFYASYYRYDALLSR